MAPNIRSHADKRQGGIKTPLTFKRSIGPKKWDQKKPLDAALLPLLDHY